MRVARLASACALVMLSGLLIGCPPGRLKIAEVADGQLVAHMEVGVIVPVHPQEMDKALKVADETKRLKAIADLQTFVVMDAWVIPGPAFRWMMVQLAELRRLKVEGE